MALQRDARYPGRWLAPSGGHPQGAFKNRSAPGALDGSYIESDWANDWDGYMSSLLIAAGVTANGTVDTVGASQYYNAMLTINQRSTMSFAVDTGTANTYVCAFTPALTVRSESAPLRIKVKTSNTTSCTLNDGLGVVPLVGGAHTPLQGGEMVANGDAWVQWNASVGTGSYILLFCTGGALQVPAGSYGITPPQFDNSSKLSTTGFLKGAGESFSTIKGVASAGTLDATYAGALTLLSGTSYVVILPAASTYPAGSVLTFYSVATGIATLNRSGADLISTNSSVSLTAIALGNGDTLTLVSNGTGIWEAVAGSAQLPYANVMVGANWTTPPQFDNSSKLSTTGFAAVNSGRFAGSTSYNVATTLTVADIGKHIVMAAAAAAFAVVLPSIASCPNGCGMRIINLSGYTITINRQGSDFIIGPYNVSGTSTTFILLNGDSVDITNTGLWMVSGSGQLAGSVQFKQLLGTTGYKYLPGGYIEQWFPVTLSTTPTTYNFPIAFPGACLQVIATSSVSTSTIGASPSSNNQYNAYASLASTIAYVRAIGN